MCVCFTAWWVRVFHGGTRIVSHVADLAFSCHVAGAFHSFGCTMTQGLLRAELGINVSRYQVTQVLKHVDPGGARRNRRSRLSRRTYKVGGPRSLYHCDGHEKLSHVFGIWIHGEYTAHSHSHTLTLSHFHSRY